MNIFNYIREQRGIYETRSIYVPGLGNWSQKDHLDKIDSYWSDTYEENDAYDDVIGAFPFENIHKAPTLLEARATDFDQKHVEVEPKDGSRKARISAMICTKAVYNQMQKIKFGVFMNEVSYIRAKYGGVIASKQGEEVVVDKWQQVINDQADVMSAPRIKRYYMSPSEISKMTAWANVETAIKTASTQRNQEIEMVDATKTAKSTGNLIEVFTVEGDLPLSMIKSAQAIRDNTIYEELEDDEYKYKYARIICCGADWTTLKDGQKFENGIIFYAEEEKMPLQKYLVRNALSGRGLGESVPEVLFEPQKWWNFTVTEEMRMMAVAGKKLYITDDPDILANIFDEGVDHGHVLRVSAGKTLKELNQIPTGLPIYQSRRTEMLDNTQRLTSSFAAATGAEAKSNVPFRAQYLQNVSATSQFEQYREEMGFFYKEIIEDWVLPDALENASKDDAIYATFTPQELQLIDEVIVESNLNDKILQMTLEKQVISPQMVDEMRLQMQSELRKDSKRTIKGIKDFIKESSKQVRIHTTDEARDKAVLFESYANLLKLLQPNDPRFNALVGKIMQALGITREELELYPSGDLQAQQGKIDTSQVTAQGQQPAQAAMTTLSK